MGLFDFVSNLFSSSPTTTSSQYFDPQDANQGLGQNPAGGNEQYSPQSVVDKVNAANKARLNKISTGEKLGHIQSNGIAGQDAANVYTNVGLSHYQDASQPQNLHGLMSLLTQLASAQPQRQPVNFGSQPVNQLLEAARGNFR
jgi:hypothetical protein